MPGGAPGQQALGDYPGHPVPRPQLRPDRHPGVSGRRECSAGLLAWGCRSPVGAPTCRLCAEHLGLLSAGQPGVLPCVSKIASPPLAPFNAASPRYPPFVKGVLDEGLARGVEWSRYNLKLVRGQRADSSLMARLRQKQEMSHCCCGRQAPLMRRPTSTLWPLGCRCLQARSSQVRLRQAGRQACRHRLQAAAQQSWDVIPGLGSIRSRGCLPLDPACACCSQSEGRHARHCRLPLPPRPPPRQRSGARSCVRAAASRSPTALLHPYMAPRMLVRL
jgi:hypothetical protein